MKVKKDSEQATKDKDLVAVIQDKNSTKREKFQFYKTSFKKYACDRYKI